MISVAMIVKNEEVMLEKALKSVRGVDEIVICDTGSTDKTVEIAKRYTDKVFTDYKWNDNFAEARNYSIDKCMGDWILILDADNTLDTPIEEIKKLLDTPADALSCACVDKGDSKKIHYLPLVFRNKPSIRFKGAIHNYLNGARAVSSPIKFSYGWSPAHKLDPYRAFRILKKEVDKHQKPREMYYLAREYWYKKDFHTAIHWLEKYIPLSKYRAEKADACLILARSHLGLNEWEKARQACLQAILLNPDFKEALDLMASLSWPAQAKKWKQFSSIAENQEVLFIRTLNKKRVYYCEGMKTFGEKLLEKGFVRYSPETDIYTPTLFQGLYFREDYDIFVKHKGEAVVYWNGSDVYRMKSTPYFQECLTKRPARHLCISKEYQRRLSEAGVQAEISPIFYGNFEDFPVSFKPGNEMYMTVNKGREKEYGLPQAIELCKKYGLKLHIYGIDGQSDKDVVYYGWVATEQMDKEIKEFQGALKFSQYGGGMASYKSQTFVKSALLGQYPIASCFKDYEKQIEEIKNKKEPNIKYRKDILKEFNQFEWLK